MLNLTAKDLSRALWIAEDVRKLERSLVVGFRNREPFPRGNGPNPLKIEMQGAFVNIPDDVVKEAIRLKVAEHHKALADMGIELSAPVEDDCGWVNEASAEPAAPEPALSR